MRRSLLLMVLTAGCAALCVSSLAAYLEEPEGTDEAAPIIVPPPLPGNPLTDAIGRISVHPGYSYRGLTVYPLITSQVSDRTDYLALPGALKAGTLVITEKGEGAVPTLIAENTGKRPILMLAGEILTGGKQNRTLREDVLLLGRSGKIELPVHCVERGRWQGRDRGFQTKSSVATLNVRVASQAGKAQQEVWDHAEAYEASVGGGSPTGDLQTTVDSPEAQKALAEYKEAFGRLWRREFVGMVVLRFGRVVGADIFCNPTVFRKHRDRLLESYALDCYVTWKKGEELGVRRHVVPPSSVAAERFLRRILQAEHVWHGTPGAGRLLRVSGVHLTGQALTYENALLHAGIFEEQPVVRPMPPIVRPILPGPLRPKEY